MMKKASLLSTLVAATAIVGATLPAADAASYRGYGGFYSPRTFTVTVTNLTGGQSFTPIIAAVHRNKDPLFTVGKAADDAIAAIAEGGDTSALETRLGNESAVSSTTTTTGLLAPGQSVSFTVNGTVFQRLSMAAMMLPTNDGMVAVQNLRLWPGRYIAKAYDAGTETNTESCDDIPGPLCGGEGPSPNDAGEGIVHPHRGISVGDDTIRPNLVNWADPVALIEISRQ